MFSYSLKYDTGFPTLLAIVQQYKHENCLLVICYNPETAKGSVRLSMTRATWRWKQRVSVSSFPVCTKSIPDQYFLHHNICRQCGAGGHLHPTPSCGCCFGASEERKLMERLDDSSTHSRGALDTYANGTGVIVFVSQQRRVAHPSWIVVIAPPAGSHDSETNSLSAHLHSSAANCIARRHV